MTDWHHPSNPFFDPRNSHNPPELHMFGLPVPSHDPLRPPKFRDDTPLVLCPGPDCVMCKLFERDKWWKRLLTWIANKVMR